MKRQGAAPHTVCFGASSTSHALAAALIAAAGVAAGGGLLHAGGPGLAAAVFLAAALALAIFLLQPVQVVIDDENRTWVQVSRLGLRKRRGSLDAFDHILVVLSTRPDWSGEWVSAACLYLAGSGTSLRLLGCGAEQDRMETAHDLAFRLRLPVHVQDYVRQPRSAAFERAMLAVLWASVAGAALATLAISLRRPPSPSMEPGAARPDMNRYAAAQLMNRARSRYRYGDARGAEHDLREILSRYPSWPDAHNLMAYALADQDRLAEALKEAQMALAMRPSDGNILDTVGEMHERRHEYRQAASYYEMALAAEDPSAALETHYKYGRTLLALGRIEEAREHLVTVAAARDPYWAPAARNLLASPAMKTARNGKTPARSLFTRRPLAEPQREHGQLRRAEKAGTTPPGAEAP